MTRNDESLIQYWTRAEDRTIEWIEWALYEREWSQAASGLVYAWAPPVSDALGYTVRVDDRDHHVTLYTCMLYGMHVAWIEHGGRRRIMYVGRAEPDPPEDIVAEWADEWADPGYRIVESP